MKVNFKQKFIDCFGRIVTEEIDGKQEPIEFHKKLPIYLFNISTTSDNQLLTPEKKYMAYRLSCKIAEHPEEVELTKEEASMIKEVSNIYFAAGAYGRIVDILEKGE